MSSVFPKSLGSEVEPPDQYRARLTSLGLRPAWDLFDEIVPLDRPTRKTDPMHWRYAEIRGELIRAAEFVGLDNAERRVIALINRAYGRTKIAATPSITVAVQLIYPGERARPHHHTPAAARFITEGTGAYTTVNGEKLPMAKGDLILTPNHQWHEHGHEGVEPVLWIDIGDMTVGTALETSYLTTTSDTGLSDRPDRSETAYRCAGFIPYRSPIEPANDFSLVRFPWINARGALMAVAACGPVSQPVHMMYVNPETGLSAFKTFNFSCRLLRPGETVAQKLTSASMLFHIIEGDGQTDIDNTRFAWEANDILAAPTFARIRHTNLSKSEPAFLLQIDDAPLQHKIGFYEEVDE
jgi:gentisate 1,2-dioxygenase